MFDYWSPASGWSLGLQCQKRELENPGRDYNQNISLLFSIETTIYSLEAKKVKAAQDRQCREYPLPNSFSKLQKPFLTLWLCTFLIKLSWQPLNSSSHLLLQTYAKIKDFLQVKAKLQPQLRRWRIRWAVWMACKGNKKCLRFPTAPATVKYVSCWQTNL